MNDISCSAFNPDTYALDFIGGSVASINAGEFTLHVGAVPEPSSAVLLAIAGLGLGLGSRKRNSCLADDDAEHD